MIAYIHCIVLRRDAQLPKDRKPIFMFIASTAEARKYKLSLILAHQSLKQISNAEIRKTIMVNTRLKALSMTDHEDRLTFSKEMGVTVDALNKLKPLQFAVKKNEG